MKNFLYHTLLLAFFSLSSGEAQVMEEWVARYNGPGNLNERAYSLAVDDSGNVYVTGGGADDMSDSLNDYVTIKYDSSGDTMWVRTYDGPASSDDDALAIVLDDLGNVYVTGISIGNGLFYDGATIKYDNLGNLLWVKRYDGPASRDDGFIDLAVDSSGNVYVTGASEDAVGNMDYVIIKYNSNGDTVWVRNYNGPGNGYDFTYDISVDAIGNVYVTGWSDSGGWPNDFATIKFDSLGDTLWVRRYVGSSWDDFFPSLAIDDAGYVYITGGSWNGSNDDYVTIKYDSNGDSVWVRRYNNPSNTDDYSTDLSVDDSGNVYVTGWSNSGGSATLKYNTLGDILWIRRNNNISSWALDLDSSGNVYVTGSATVKYNGNGDSIWIMNYPNSYFWNIAVDDLNNVYVTGEGTFDSLAGFDYITIKYSQTVGVEEENGKFKLDNEKFTLFQNSPNPFQFSTFIHYQIPSTNPALNLVQGRNTNHVTLKIYDITGRLVEALVNEHQEPGAYEVEWKGKNQSNGIYFYRLTAGNHTSVKKLILLK